MFKKILNIYFKDRKRVFKNVLDTYEKYIMYM